MDFISHSDLVQIKSTEVPEQERLNVLPKHFQRHMMLVEQVVYEWMRRFCDEYNGGFWAYFELSNGGFFMAPMGMGGVTLSNAMNQSSTIFSSEAAGITACLMAYNHIAHHYSGRNDEQAVELFVTHFDLLRDYAGQHPECGNIFMLID